MVIKLRKKKVCGPSKEKDEQIMKKRVGKAFAKSLTKGIENPDKMLKYSEAKISPPKLYTV